MSKPSKVLSHFRLNLLILVKKQEPEQASNCPGEYPKDRNNVYLNEATIVGHGTLRVKYSEVTTNISKKKVSCT